MSQDLGFQDLGFMVGVGMAAERELEVASTTENNLRAEANQLGVDAR